MPAGFAVNVCLSVTCAVVVLECVTVPGAADVHSRSVTTCAITSLTTTSVSLTVIETVGAPGWACSLTVVVPAALPRTWSCRSRLLSVDAGDARKSAMAVSDTSTPVAQLVTSRSSA